MIEQRRIRVICACNINMWKGCVFMKKLFSLLLVFTILCINCTTAAIAGSNDEWVAWFQSVTSRPDVSVAVASIYWDDALVLSIPVDWSQGEIDDLITFTGSDELGNEASVALQVADSMGMSLDDFAKEVRTSRASCQIKKNDFTFFSALEGENIYSAWLSEDDESIYILRASLKNVDGIMSDKLINDLHQILCGLRLPYDGELEERRARNSISEQDFSEAEMVSFQDPGFERMVREAMGKAEEEAIYRLELETITRLNMRFGVAAFTEEVLPPVMGYRQEKPLDLSDLTLFPNLSYVSITDMDCTGFEALHGLPKLRKLTLIDAGVNDCGVLEGLSLESLSLARNSIADFSVLATMMGLKSLNLYMTGLDSLELLSNLKNLELLVVGDNPISDLEPVKGMTNLRYLSIQNTGVQSLEALRHLERLETLNISELGSISLEPLYGHKNLREIMKQDTEISEDDKALLADIVHPW